MNWFTLTIVLMSQLIGHTISYRRFAQISDVHLDQEYVAGARVDKMCHNSSKYLAEADGGASKYGDFRCDSPRKLLISAIKYLQKVEPDPDFILWTGDNSPHWWDEEDRTWDEVYDNMKKVVRTLREAYPKTLIVPALGNHDSHPADFYADPGINMSVANKMYSGYVKQGSLGDLLRDYPESKAKFKECGFYSLKHKNYTNENITQTFLVLNTNLYYNNKAKTIETDPCGQFKWLETELRNAKENERVFIVAHVPPGFFELHTERPFFDSDNHTKIFKQILSEKRAAQKIVAHFYGHMHTDAIRLFMGSEDDVRGIAFAAPSVTPLMFEGGVNPSVRIYDYDPENRVVVDYETHYLPLDRLIVHEPSTSDAPETREEDDADVNVDDDDEVAVSTGESKSRRQNSKILDREQRQVDNLSSSTSTTTTTTTASTTTNITTTTIRATTTSTTTQTPNEDETFESLAPETPTKEPKSATIQPEEEAETTTTTTSSSSSSTTSTTATPAALSSPASDPDVDFLVGQWTIGYKKLETFNIENFSPKNMYKAYMKMLQDRPNSGFKNYQRQTWILHDPKGRMDCNDTCHALFMCAMVHFTSEDFFDCVNEGGSLIPDTTPLPPPSFSATPSTPIYTRAPRPTFPATPQYSSSGIVLDSGVQSSEIDTGSDDGTSVVRGIAIGFAGIALIAIAVLSLAFYRRTRMSRYRSQEFLLTDSVFRYDGYAQVEQP